MTDEAFLREAIAEARAAEQAGEVPVGAVLVFNNEIIARGRNRVISDSDPTAHAEIVALREAGRVLGNYRLEDCDLYTTLEPCAMCAGAILHARIRRLIYAAADHKAGACGSALEVLNHPSLNHKLEVTNGLLAEECGQMLSAFFRTRRLKNKENAAPRVSIEALMTTAKSVPAKAAKKSAAKKTTKKAVAKTPHKWSAKVATDSTHPHEGLFNEDAATIAKDLASKDVSPKGPASGMRMLNFYINRAGKNLTKTRIAELEKAKTILSKLIAEAKPAAKAPTRKAATRRAVKTSAK